MKKNVIKAFLIAAISLSVIACQKSDSPKEDPTALKIDASKTTAKVGESVTIQVKNSSSDLVAVWSVSPASSASLLEKYSSNQKNTISFSAAGTYTITADLKKVSCDSVAIRSMGMDTCLKMAPVQSSANVKIVVNN
jgi:plastocyanin